MRNWKFLIKLLADKPHINGAEIGVFEGDCAIKLLEELPNLERLTCVDMWQDNTEFHKLMPNKCGRILRMPMLQARLKFIDRAAVHYRRVLMLQMESTEAAEITLDGSLDFVFIDANHAYEFVMADIEAWLPKVEFGGIIAGHDYVNKPNYGVTKAVNEVFGNEFRVDKKSKIWYTTRERNQSWVE